MKKCFVCGEVIPNWFVIDGKPRNLSKRKRCLKCSPFGRHNTSKLTTLNGKRTCTKCLKELSDENFAKKGKGRMHSWCKPCLYAKQYEGDKERKRKAVEYKGGKCKRCGYDKCMGAMHFHHNDPSKKDISFQKLRNRKWSVYKKELDKCTLLCSNCHAEEHHS